MKPQKNQPCPGSILAEILEQPVVPFHSNGFTGRLCAPRPPRPDSRPYRRGPQPPYCW